MGLKHPQPSYEGLNTLANLGVSSKDNDSLRLNVRRQCCESLFFLCKAVLGFHDLTPGLHLPVAKFIQNEQHTRKLLEIPRGHFKSTILSIGYPIWRLLPKAEGWEDISTDGPNSRILLASCTATNAEHFLRRIKAVFESNELFTWVFPEFKLDFTKVRKWTETEIELPRARQYPEASIETIGAGGRVTSRHFTDIIKDDLVEESISDSIEELEKVIKWHEYAESLLESPERDRDYICGTRYNQADLYGYIRKNDKRYQIYGRKAIEEDKPIFPERFTMNLLGDMQIRKPYVFATQYMNNPIDPSVVDFKEHWLRYYSLTPAGLIRIDSGPDKGKFISPKQLNTYIHVDPAISEEKDACRTAIINSGIYDPEHIFILNAQAKQINPLQTIDTVFGLARILRPHKVGFESVAYQKALKYFMEDKSKRENFHLTIEELKPEAQHKDARIRGLVTYFASGYIYIRKEFADFIEEYLSFPNGKYKDLLDCLAYGPRMWIPPDLSGSANITDDDIQDEALATGRSVVTGY